MPNETSLLSIFLKTSSIEDDGILKADEPNLLIKAASECVPSGPR